MSLNTPPPWLFYVLTLSVLILFVARLGPASDEQRKMMEAFNAVMAGDLCARFEDADEIKKCRAR